MRDKCPFIEKTICHRYQDWAPNEDFDQQEKPVCEHTDMEQEHEPFQANCNTNKNNKNIFNKNRERYRNVKTQKA